MAKQSDSIDRETSISRRDFARHAALAATVAVLPGRFLAQPSSAPPQAAPAEKPKLSPEAQAEVHAKIEAIMRKRGSRLSEEQKKDVRRLVTEGQASLENLRAFALENSDQPATVLRIYPQGAINPRRQAPKQ